MGPKVLNSISLVSNVCLSLGKGMFICLFIYKAVSSKKLLFRTWFRS
jgi:hypothetical protein